MIIENKNQKELEIIDIFVNPTNPTILIMEEKTR